ncbi:MAG: hypothetical protein NVSMB32_13690 [Actinomycetota bacterium]
MHTCRLGRWLTVLVTVAAIASACSSKTTTATAPSGSKTTLNLAYLATISTPDPDVFYDIEGNSIILSVYQGLVNYKPETTIIQPVLATSWDISADGMTYTFHLRTGVTFHDGTPFNAAAVKASFDRRTAVGGGPAYMLNPVDHYETPDPATFIVKLKTPWAPFMDYMASSWGPKIISPTVLTANAGKDTGQTDLQSHAVGTGPFKMDSFNAPGKPYAVLTRYDGYWGTKANFQTVNINLVTDMNTQFTQLKQGGLDIILHSLPYAELPAAQSDANLSVQNFSSYLQSLLYFNPNKAPFNSLDMRKAVTADINRDQIVSTVYGSYGHPAASPYAPGILDQTLAPISYPTATVKVPATPVIMAYSADESGIQSRLAQLIQQHLQAQGFQVTLKEVPNTTIYTYNSPPANLTDPATPNLLLMTNTPDAASPDTWARILWDASPDGKGGLAYGGLDFLGYSNPDVDTALNTADTSTDKAVQAQNYAKAGQVVNADLGVLFLADTSDVMVLRKDLTGIRHVPNYPWTLDLAALSRS